MRNLTGKETRHLRGLGHHLKPVVMIGKEEVNDRVIQAVEESLDAHELIKVKIQEGCMMDREELAGIIVERTGAALVQILGKTLLFYRPSDKEKIKLPGGGPSGS